MSHSSCSNMNLTKLQSIVGVILIRFMSLAYRPMPIQRSTQYFRLALDLVLERKSLARIVGVYEEPVLQAVLSCTL